VKFDASRVPRPPITRGAKDREPGGQDAVSEINPWAVLVAALSCFLLGGLWYSPALFGKAWNKAAGRPAKATSRGTHPAKVFALSFVFAILAATAFSAWVGPHPTFQAAVTQGLFAGGCFVAASFGINYQFADRGVKLWVIDAGYHTVQFLLFGTVFWMWP